MYSCTVLERARLLAAVTACLLCISRSFYRSCLFWFVACFLTCLMLLFVRAVASGCTWYGNGQKKRQEKASKKEKKAWKQNPREQRAAFCVAYPAANEMKSPADSLNPRLQSHACCGTYFVPRPESRLRLYNTAIAHRHTPGPGRLYTKYGALFGIAYVVRPRRCDFALVLETTATGRTPRPRTPRCTVQYGATKASFECRLTARKLWASQPFYKISGHSQERRETLKSQSPKVLGPNL